MNPLYITDEVNTCECCGRTDLKATVAMQLNDGRIVYYGRTCAARNSGKTKQQIKQEIFNEKARQERQLAKMAANAKALAAWQADDFGCPALQAQLCNYHQTGGVSVHGSFSQWLHNRATGVAA